MIEPVPLTTAQKTVVGLKSQQFKKRMKWGNSDIPRFQYKVTMLFDLKCFPEFVLKSNEHMQTHC